MKLPAHIYSKNMRILHLGTWERKWHGMQVVCKDSPVERVLGFFNLGLGLAGLSVGLVFSQPSILMAGYSTLHSLGQFAVILGPLEMIAGGMMLAWSIHRERSTRKQLEAQASLRVSTGFSFSELRKYAKDRHYL